MTSGIRNATYAWLIGSRAGIAVLECIRAIALFMRALPHNVRFRLEHPAYRVPPLGLMLDAQGHMDYRQYHQSGKETADLYARLFDKHLERCPSRRLRILEWGCGTGRIIRHLGSCFPGQEIELFGSDYNPASIAWCARALPDIRFTTNGLMPPLAFDDRFFDVVYCRSVFTHLGIESIKQWLKELERVTRTDGLICFSTMGNGMLGRMSETEKMRFIDGQPITRDIAREGKKYFAAIHPPAYVRKEFVATHPLLETILFESGSPSQDVWLIRNGGSMNASALA